MCYIARMSELLAPAGNLECLDAAISEGADAVYLGLKSFNARIRASNFAWNQFEAAVSAVHRQGKKIYVTVNTVCEENETERLYRFLSYLNKVRPDALIIQDFAVIRMAQEFFPDLPLHASTQMNAESAAAVNLLAKEGVRRVVLARELGMEEVKSIRRNTDAELEMFVHGALCVSESGLCLFSSFLGGKSANRGMCAQACRRYYTADYYAGGPKKGYFFSPCDLQLIEYLPELAEIGIDSFKIEGRMKSAEYVGGVTAAYRYVLDHWREDKKGAVSAGKRMLASDFARSKTSYWFGFQSAADGVLHAGGEILNPDQAGGTGIYLGQIAAVKDAPRAVPPQDGEGDGSAAPVPARDGNSGPQESAPPAIQRLARLTGGSYEPDPGDSVRLHKKDDTGRESHKIRYTETDRNGRRWIDIPAGFKNGDSVYLLQIKSQSKRYPRVLPNDLSRFRRQPADERLPVLDLTPVAQHELDYFPEGIYVQVSSVEDIFVSQGLHPVRVIVELNSDTRNALISGSVTFPFPKKSMYISLDPYCPAAGEGDTAADAERLIDAGFTNFVANNVAHLAMLRGRNVNLIAGPYLYTFNRWAVSWLENHSVSAFVMPYENSRRNLEATFELSRRRRVLVPVFAYPALFRMRFRLPESYDFSYFRDKEDEEFKALSTPDGSFVMPEMPFSLLDKTDALQKDGFKRFLIDFSRIRISKNQIRAIVGSMANQRFLSGVSRFNWKNGFYFSPETGRTGASAQSVRVGQSRISGPRPDSARQASERDGRKASARPVSARRTSARAAAASRRGDADFSRAAGAPARKSAVSRRPSAPRGKGRRK